MNETPNQAMRTLLFRKAENLNQQLLKRLGDAQEHLSKHNELAAIGALAGMESDVSSIRKLMTLVRDCFQTKNGKEA
jgi:hypothetical protein